MVTTELVILAFATVLGLIHLVIAAAYKRRQDGNQWAMGSRDEQKNYSGVAERLDRAEKNFLETFPYFAVGILLVHAQAHEGFLSSLGAWLYLIARIAYIPLYASGVSVVRSIVWGVSMIGIVLVLIAIL